MFGTKITLKKIKNRYFQKSLSLRNSSQFHIGMLPSPTVNKWARHCEALLTLRLITSFISLFASSVGCLNIYLLIHGFVSVTVRFVHSSSYFLLFFFVCLIICLYRVLFHSFIRMLVCSVVYCLVVIVYQIFVVRGTRVAGMNIKMAALALFFKCFFKCRRIPVSSMFLVSFSNFCTIFLARAVETSRQKEGIV